METVVLKRMGQRLTGVENPTREMLYVSPFWRARSTFEGVVKNFPSGQFFYSEEPRIREQEWGYLRCNEDFDKICGERRE